MLEIPKIKFPHIKNHHFSLHSRKMILLCLILIVFMMDLSIITSGQKLSRELAASSLTEYMKETAWVRKARAMVKGTPMEKMVPYMNDKQKDTTAYLVSVAKQESNWGKRSPHLNGKDCYNYWGYMGHTENVTPSGYTCFSSPQEAVDVVGHRFNVLINQKNLDTPQEMAVWKCGYDCSWDNPASVQNWIQNVRYYYKQFYE